MAKKTSERTLKVIPMQVEANPYITSRELVESNPLLLGNISERTVSRRLRDDIDYK